MALCGHTCKDGDQLDAICKEIYGYGRGSTEAVLSHESNRELARKTRQILRQVIRFTCPTCRPKIQAFQPSTFGIDP